MSRPVRFTLGEAADAGTIVTLDLGTGLLRPVRDDDPDLTPDELGDSLDLPYADAAPGTELDASDALIAGGLVVMAAVVPVPEVGPCPGLHFRFARPDGAFLRPVLLVLDDAQAAQTRHLITASIQAARDAARKARGRG